MKYTDDITLASGVARMGWAERKGGPRPRPLRAAIRRGGYKLGW